MKWTENGITFEGTPAEYRELHADGFQQHPQRTHRGKQVIVEESEDIHTSFPTVIEAAQWITQKTGRYVSASKLGKMLDENGHVHLERFVSSVSLFENANSTNNQGEENGK